MDLNALMSPMLMSGHTTFISGAILICIIKFWSFERKISKHDELLQIIS